MGITEPCHAAQDLELAVALNLFLSRIGERDDAALTLLTSAAVAFEAMAGAVHQMHSAADVVESVLQRVPAANMDIAVLPVSITMCAMPGRAVPKARSCYQMTSWWSLCMTILQPTFATCLAQE